MFLIASIFGNFPLRLHTLHIVETDSFAYMYIYKIIISLLLKKRQLIF